MNFHPVCCFIAISDSHVKSYWPNIKKIIRPKSTFVKHVAKWHPHWPYSSGTCERYTTPKYRPSAPIAANGMWRVRSCYGMSLTCTQPPIVNIAVIFVVLYHRHVRRRDSTNVSNIIPKNDTNVRCVRRRLKRPHCWK